MGKLAGILLLSVVLLFSCEKGGQFPRIPAGIPRDPTLGLSRSDPALRDIRLRAREGMPSFLRKLQNPGPGEANFMVKCPFPADEGSGFRFEEIWLRDISFAGGVYSGALANQPYYVGPLKTGGRVSFAIDDISDWMYTKDGRIVGGLSIKYLIEGIPELDRDAAASAWYGRFTQ